MTTRLIKRDNEDLNKLITGIGPRIGTTVDPFLTDFRDEKLYCMSQVRCYLRIL